MNRENNIITTDNNDLIGYYKDLKKYFAKSILLAIEQNNYELFCDMVDTFKELMEYSESDSLLRVSENNGMGLTIKEIKGE